MIFLLILSDFSDEESSNYLTSTNVQSNVSMGGPTTAQLTNNSKTDLMLLEPLKTVQDIDKVC